ncbi:FAD binding domain-containing protein [Triangularia verruculosa]|uniref:FAD binding domain-containing protein n=1 Tax=Triangularia verruculosa TaxID=2587418 RepID=A0AAN7AVS0_9PEZI|nr:FAD binding domain-containing protein [Triangularia verruculosa]
MDNNPDVESPATDCDVLIVGCGPVGAALALELALHQVSFRIIDRLHGPSPTSRALIIQPRTLELFNRYGAAEELIPRGRILSGMAMCLDGKPAGVIALNQFKAADTRFPLPLNISQAETERFLFESLSSRGISVERATTATSVVQDENGVTTTLQFHDGREELVRTKYVIGCDGARSSVRKAAEGMTFEGSSYPQAFLLCDVHIRNSLRRQDQGLIQVSREGMFGIFPIRGDVFRIVVSGLAATYEHQGDISAVPTVEYFQTLFDKFTPPGSGTLEDPVWINRFRLHLRGVNKYRDRRVFVAGDAAHISSPVGGKGMNTGIQDAINIGWKLALVLQGQVQDPEAFLDTYHNERHPIGAELLKSTDKMFTFMTSTNRFFIPIRNFAVKYILPFLTPTDWWNGLFYKFLSMFGVTYRETSSIVGTATGFKGSVRGGDRLPDAKLWLSSESGGIVSVTVQGLCVGGSHHLLLFSGGHSEDETNELEYARDEVLKVVAFKLGVHFVYRSVRPERAMPSNDWYLWPSDSIEEVILKRYGFSDQSLPGYILVRPDGYVAHIGPLTALDELLSFLRTHFVAPIETVEDDGSVAEYHSTFGEDSSSEEGLTTELNATTQHESTIGENSSSGLISTGDNSSISVSTFTSASH